MDIRYSLAVGAARLGGAFSRGFGYGGGTSLPGFIATRIDPAIVKKLAGRLSKSVLVTGTNGKTTTSNMLAAIIAESGQKPVHNSAGANLVAGVVTAIIYGTNGDRKRGVGLFEADEAVTPQLTEPLKPDAVVVTNIFRDQLDRYGELDKTAALIKKALTYLNDGAIAVLNADDPRVASLNDKIASKALYFGIDDNEIARESAAEASDSANCPVCGAPLEYTQRYFSHLGKYECPSRDFMRPKLDVKAKNIGLSINGLNALIDTPSGLFDLKLKLSGLYNLYNALAATAAAVSLGINNETIKKALAEFTPAFGRLEHIRVGDKLVHLMLIKNPTGFNQIIETLNLDETPKDLIIAINDNIADGKDVSWLWDVDIERLKYFKRIIASGVRAEDMAVRLKYAGVEPDHITIENDMEKAIDEGIKRVAAGKTLYVLPTYTAMLDMRRYLEKIGNIKAFWEKSD